MQIITFDSIGYTFDSDKVKFDGWHHQGGGDVDGWANLRNLPARKQIPRQVKEVIIELLVKQPKAPITKLRSELKALEIAYDSAYGDFLKKLLNEAIQEEVLRKKAFLRARDEEDMMIIMEFL